MTSHVRIQLRDAIQTKLNAQVSLTGRVYVNRADPFQDTDLPAVLVMVSEGKVMRETMDAPALLNWQVGVQIDILAKLVTGFDDALETIATTIETALGTSPPLPGTNIKDLLLVSFAKSKPDGQSQDDLINLRLDYAALMMTRENDPTTLI